MGTCDSRFNLDLESIEITTKILENRSTDSNRELGFNSNRKRDTFI